MGADRRTFLKIAGLGVLVVGADRVLESALAQPGAGQPSTKGALAGRWGMLIDTSRCPAGCTECRKACHLAHNVPDIASKQHEVKWIWNEPFEHIFPDAVNEFVAERLEHKTVPVLCNHCENPPCVRVCPTKATWKRADGIVMSDWHRCLGCRYCMVACPYGARSFNFRDPRPFVQRPDPSFPTRTKGVVEKCTFCSERLSRGLRPACVDACPQGAIVFGDLDDKGSELRRRLGAAMTMRRKPALGTSPKVFYKV